MSFVYRAELRGQAGIASETRQRGASTESVLRLKRGIVETIVIGVEVVSWRKRMINPQAVFIELLETRLIEVIIRGGYLTQWRSQARGGEVRRDRLAQRTQRRCGDNVVRENSACERVFQNGGLTECKQRAEVTCQHGRGGNRGERRQLLAKPQALIAVEEESLVLSNGTAGRSTELIALISGLAPRGGKVIAGVEKLISHKLERAAVILIGSRFRHHDDLAPGTVAVLSRKNSGQQPEFLNGIDGRQERRTIDARIVVVDPIHAEVVVGFRCSRDIKPAPVAHC